LNFKTGLISGVFPGAGFLVCIRHPGAQIASVMRLFSGGSLGELNKSLLTFINDIENHPRFEAYGDLIRRFDWQNDPGVKLALWWLLNYNVLLEDLERFQCAFRLVYHEEISENPYRVVREIFDFCGLDFVEEVQAYLDLSSKSSDNIRSNVDTRRDSANYYKQMIGAVDPRLNDKIREIVQYYENGLEPHLRQYLKKFYQLKAAPGCC